MPLDGQAESADQLIRFSGTVQWEDLEQFGRSGMRGYVAALSWPITGVLYLAIFSMLSTPNMHAPSAGDPCMPSLVFRLSIVAAFVAQATACMLVTMRLIGYLYARSNVAAAPDLLGPVSGTLGAHTIELVHPHARRLLPLDSLSDVRLTSGGIGLLIDDDRMSLIVLPRHLFEEREFAQAGDRLTAAWHHRQPPSSLQASQSVPRSEEPEPQGWVAKPTDAYAFSAGVLLSECQWTPTYREQVARIYGFFGCLLFNAVMLPLPTVFFVRSSIRTEHVIFFVPGLVVLILLGHMTGAFWRLWSMRRSRIAPVSGWLAEDGLTVNSAIGSTTYFPSAFGRVESSKRSVQLIFPGQYQQTLVLSKPMFESAEGFEQLRLWASTGTSRE